MLRKQFFAAHIGSPFGVRGFLRLISYSGSYEHLEPLQSLILAKDGLEQVFEVEEQVYKGNQFLVKLKGIDSPEAATQLKGMQLVVDLDQAAKLDKNEYYIEDLKGLELVFKGRPMARVLDVVETGPGELLEVKNLEDGKIQLIPFRNEFLGKIDIKAGSIELLVDWILA